MTDQKDLTAQAIIDHLEKNPKIEKAIIITGRTVLYILAVAFGIGIIGAVTFFGYDWLKNKEKKLQTFQVELSRENS